jgi:hypothetical protein
VVRRERLPLRRFVENLGAARRRHPQLPQPEGSPRPGSTHSGTVSANLDLRSAGRPCIGVE